jgi:transmembrane sensor
MKASAAEGLTGAHLEEASAWRARIAQSPELADSPVFQAWLGEADNRARYAQVTQAWDVLGMIAASPAVLAARQDSLRALRRQARGDTARRRAATAAAIAAGLGLTIVAGGYFYQHDFAFQTYETGPMERRTVMLSDGSQVALDSATRLSLRFTPGERRLELTQGQANFSVAHNVARPFRVVTPSRVVTATGTRFDVDLFGGQTTVTLAEGHVRVSRVAAAPNVGAVTLDPGQQLVAEGASDTVRSVDASEANAWEQGKVVFDDELLPAAVSRFNRYAHRPWRVDPALGALRISGVFDVDNPDAFIGAVTAYFNLDAQAGANGAVELRPGQVRGPAKKSIAAR